MTPRASNMFGPMTTPHSSSTVNNNNVNNTNNNVQTHTTRETILTARSRSPSSSRMSTVPASHLHPAPQIIQRHDLLFLVGDSLTAADISLMMALHTLLSIEELKTIVISRFVNCVKYYRAMMLLPLITQLRRALRITIINS